MGDVHMMRYSYNGSNKDRDQIDEAVLPVAEKGLSANILVERFVEQAPPSLDSADRRALIGREEDIDESEDQTIGRPLYDNIWTERERRREGVRTFLVRFCALMVATMVFGGFYGWIAGLNLDTWAAYTFPVMTLVASVVGFYFSGSRN